MRIISALLLGLLVASCASQGPKDRGPRSFGKPVANPSAVVAAELRFARLAQEKGQWTAFRETAAEDAAKKAMDCGMGTVSVLVVGPGSGRESAMRAVAAAGMKIGLIRDVTPIPHNGCRPPKRRRV